MKRNTLVGAICLNWETARLSMEPYEKTKPVMQTTVVNQMQKLEFKQAESSSSQQKTSKQARKSFTITERNITTTISNLMVADAHRVKKRKPRSKRGFLFLR